MSKKEISARDLAKVRGGDTLTTTPKCTKTTTTTYQKVTWTWIDGGVTAMDDWELPLT